MEIPNRADWGDIDETDLDGKCSFEHFFDVSFDEAEAMFQRNALYYQEDLQSMPSAAFNFYAPALAKYIISERAAGDSDGASSFLHTVAWMLKTQRNIIASETEKLLLSASDYVARNQQFYEADVDIYGKFSDTYEEIRSLAEHRT